VDRLAGAYARQAPPFAHTTHRRAGVVTGPEREHLAAGFAAALRAVRLDGEWTLRDLAGRLGTPHTTLSRLERGERRPSRAMLRALCRVLAHGDQWEADRLYARLAALAGDSLVPGTVAGERRRARRMWRVEQASRREQAAVARAQREAAQFRIGPRALTRIITGRINLAEQATHLAAIVGRDQLAPAELDQAAALTERITTTHRALDAAAAGTKPPRENPHA
jgi:transcriptional regulator with XRE-family HTH domain